MGWILLSTHDPFPPLWVSQLAEKSPMLFHYLTGDLRLNLCCNLGALTFSCYFTVLLSFIFMSRFSLFSCDHYNAMLVLEGSFRLCNLPNCWKSVSLTTAFYFMCFPWLVCEFLKSKNLIGICTPRTSDLEVCIHIALINVQIINLIICSHILLKWQWVFHIFLYSEKILYHDSYLSLKFPSKSFALSPDLEVNVLVIFSDSFKHFYFCLFRLPFSWVKIGNCCFPLKPYILSKNIGTKLYTHHIF